MAHDRAMLATRVSIVAELLIAAAATVLIAVTPSRSSPPVHRESMHVVHVELMSAPHKRDCSLSGNRSAMYRARDFGAAALALGSCSEADLMRELDRTYTIATAVNADLRDRFDAVREAYRIDLAFGGEHSSELLDAEKMIAARYANTLGNPDEAQRVARIVAALH
jgi:hypothetical protein